MSHEVITLTDDTASDADKAATGLLDLLAEGKPYAFVVASVTDDEKLLLELRTNIPAEDTHILGVLLEGSLVNLRS